MRGLYKAFNSIVVSLIPKSDEDRSIKDYRAITGYTLVYKIISKIITTILGKVFGSIINQSHDAFVLRQQIHNHILLSYEFIKGYSRKGGTPRCKMQINL